MIDQRYAWLLRNEDTAFDSAPPGGGHACRVCRIKDRGEIVVSHSARAAHLAAHRREKVVREKRDDKLEDVAA